MERLQLSKSEENSQNKTWLTWEKNICGTPLADFYPGTAHLGFRSVEILCLRMLELHEVCILSYFEFILECDNSQDIMHISTINFKEK